MMINQFQGLLTVLLLLLSSSCCSAFVPSSPITSILNNLNVQSSRRSVRQYASLKEKEENKMTFPWQKQPSKQPSSSSSTTIITDGMPELDVNSIDLDQEERDMALELAGAEFSLEKLLLPIALGAVASLVAGLALMSPESIQATVTNAVATFQHFQADPQGTIESVLAGMGPLGIVYFGAFYVLAELLAIPATPLTLSAGYLFGLTQGIAVVLAAGTLSACIGFVIGKTLLRSWVETVLEENPKFQKLDTAIGAEGFKLLCLVRLSPIFPFALLNYTYGASSIRFPTFVAGTLVGFAPSTIGYVYTGLVGKELLLGQGSQPWYVYAVGLTALLGVLKLVTDVATEIVGAIEEE